MSYWSSQLSIISGQSKQIKINSADGATKWLSITDEQFESIRDLLLSIEEPEERVQRVIFRYFPHDGAVIALFPDQYNERNGNIMSYMELGQHAETAPDFGDTKAADQYRYDSLLTELYRQGYNNLKIVQRFGKLGRK